MSRGNVLCADNDADFLETRAEFLERLGYRVLKAFSPEQARQQLDNANVHLAVLDLRLVDDDDDKDTSGLTLARDPAYRPVAKIILSNFPTYQAVREALGPAVEGLPPAVDFLHKNEGAGAMIRAVERALNTYVRINRDLEIHWDAQERLSFLYLAGLLQSNPSSDTFVQRVDELEDLFRRLFYDYRHLRITHLFWHGGERLCLSVLALSAQGATDARIVVCGKRGPLEQELTLVRELAPETLQGIRLDDTRETVHFGAAAYAVPDTDLETIRPLRTLLEEGKERPIKAAFRHLLAESLADWHGRGRIVVDQDLLALYRARAGLGDDALPRAEAERRVDAIVQTARAYGDVQRGGGSLVFRFRNQPTLVCPDPVAAAYGSLERYASANRCCISPGQLTPDNVLVDRGQRVWLTNFAQAGPVPLWWDFACLEASVRFDLGQAPDWLALLDFEECLTRSAHLLDRLRAQDVVVSLRTNVVLIEQIRRQAGGETGPDLLPYEAALLVCAVGAMVGHDPGMLHTQAERMRGAHLLVAASLLAGRVVQPPSALAADATSGGTLRLDADGVHVWRGEERLPDLGKQALALFRCLYDKAGQVVSRARLIEHVFASNPPIDPEGSLNALVRRLRLKIEPNPDRPQYLFRSPGQGYWLNIEGG